MDARGIQHRVRRLIDISFEEPALRDKLIRSVETLEKDILSGTYLEQVSGRPIFECILSDDNQARRYNIRFN